MENNMLSIFETGEGVYPYEFWLETPSYQKRDISQKAFESNAEMCNYLLGLVKNMNGVVYYKDMGLLDFPAVSLIIPGISEVVYDVENSNNIRQLFSNNRFIELYNKIDLISDEEVDELISILEEKNKDSEYNIQNMLRIPIKMEENHFSDITIDLLLVMLYIFKENYKDAISNLKKFLNYMKINDADEEAIEYNEMILTILQYKIKGFDNKAIIEALSIFFDKEQIQESLFDLEKKNIFSGLPTCDINNCENCDSYNNCYYREEKRIFNTLISLRNGK